MIKVAWFASGFVGRSASGTAQTARKIVEYLVSNANDVVEVTLLLKNLDELELVQKDKTLASCKWTILPSVKGKFLKSSRQYYKYAFQSKNMKFDVLHFSVPRLYPFFWKFPAKRFVCTFHAGGEITVPTDAFVLSRVIYNFLMKWQWRKLDAIYADSDFGVTEITKAYNIPNKYITKIYLGADNMWNTLPTELNDFDRSRPTILIIGRWQKYKNIHSVLYAIHESNNELIKSCKIIVLGKSEQLGNSLVNAAVQLFKKDQLKLVNYATEPELKFLYNNVQLVIHPSINEGFGIPAFEAFAEGAVLIVHEGTPADEYLSKYDGVLSGDMRDKEKIQNLIINGLKLTKQNQSIRQKYLNDMGMTWNFNGLSTLQSYKNILD
jgi:glycosyltransferase involved in cell wall biosynthesis